MPTRVRALPQARRRASHRRMGARSTEEDMRELLVRSMTALRLLQIELSELLGVSARTMRRWVAGGTRLTAEMLVTLATAVHKNDPPLAARLAVAHGHTLEDLGLGSPELALSGAIVRAAGDAVGASPIALRPAVAAAFAHARAAGLTMDAACALFARPAKARPKKG